MSAPTPVDDAGTAGPAAGIQHTLNAAMRLLEGVGVPIATVTAASTGLVQIRPRRLVDGAAVARQLGLSGSMAHLHMTPPQREFSGVIDGLEIHVHAAYDPAGAA